MDSLRRSIKASDQFTPNDRIYAIVLMFGGSLLLTSVAFSPDEDDLTNQRIVTSWGCLILFAGTLILCVEHLRRDLVMWNLLITGCIGSGGALGFATLLVGRNWKTSACGTWGWVVGMALFSQLKIWQRQKKERSLELEFQEGQLQSP